MTHPVAPSSTKSHPICYKCSQEVEHSWYTDGQGRAMCAVCMPCKTCLMDGHESCTYKSGCRSMKQIKLEASS